MIMNELLPLNAMQFLLGKVEIDTLIKRIQGRRLTQVERNYLSHSIKPKLLAARILTSMDLLGKIGRQQKDVEKTIAYNLSRLGYSLLLEKEMIGNKLSIENLIVSILTQCPKARFIEAIPFLLLKNKADPFILAGLCTQNGIGNKMGYLLEVTRLIALKRGRELPLQEFYHHLEKEKTHEEDYLGERRDELYHQFLIKTTPPRLRKWNLLGRFYDDDFFHLSEALL